MSDPSTPVADALLALWTHREYTTKTVDELRQRTSFHPLTLNDRIRQLVVEAMISPRIFRITDHARYVFTVNLMGDLRGNVIDAIVADVGFRKSSQ
jgi:hypothetical protein